MRGKPWLVFGLVLILSCAEAPAQEDALFRKIMSKKKWKQKDLMTLLVTSAAEKPVTLKNLDLKIKIKCVERTQVCVLSLKGLK